MADLTNRLPQNVPGPFYVDDTCIDCDMCRSNAPDFFRRDDRTSSSYVYRQPVTPEEWAVAEESRRDCPTESIGNNGAANPVCHAGPGTIHGEVIPSSRTT
jgi:ferredoxin